MSRILAYALTATLALTAPTLTRAQAAKPGLTDGHAMHANADPANGPQQALAQSSLRGQAGASDRSAGAAPIMLAFARSSDANRAPAGSNAQGSRSPSEPKRWMLVLIGVLLIGAMAHRRFDSMEG